MEKDQIGRIIKLINHCLKVKIIKDEDESVYENIIQLLTTQKPETTVNPKEVQQVIVKLEDEWNEAIQNLVDMMSMFDKGVKSLTAQHNYILERLKIIEEKIDTTKEEIDDSKAITSQSEPSEKEDGPVKETSKEEISKETEEISNERHFFER
jgi:hypothetical protein